MDREPDEGREAEAHAGAKPGKGWPRVRSRLVRKRRLSPEAESIGATDHAAPPGLATKCELRYVAALGVADGVMTALCQASDGRYQAVEAGDPRAVIVIAAPAFRVPPTPSSGRRLIVYYDHAGTSDAKTAADALRNGGDAFVTGPSMEILVAHLDACWRRAFPSFER